MNDISLMEKATSSEFLQTRIDLNKNALNNFEHWSINTMPKIPMKSNILDIGCGTGKQLLSFSSFFTKKCTYYGCDISKESLMIIENNYQFFQLLVVRRMIDNGQSYSCVLTI